MASIDLLHAMNFLETFTRADLTGTLSSIEAAVKGNTASSCSKILADYAVNAELLSAAATFKRIAGQLNVAIHAAGILLCLPHILEQDEIIEYASLGAGNTGRPFDLETNVRIAEFKFIHWKGGPDSIRQNSLFKDFYELAESETSKKKFLYVLGTERPLAFFNGRRALITSILNKNTSLRDRLVARYGQRYAVVRDYFADHGGKVEIEDVSQWLRAHSFLIKRQAGWCSGTMEICKKVISNWSADLP
jgi:hypothetical protein